MTNDPIRIVYLTAGAAGMYCGSCLHDNTLAAALVRLGVDIQLIPTYTPIRTDEQDVSADYVFFGGINVYLQQKSALFRWLPSALDRVLDRPWLLRRATARSTAIDPKFLGDLAVSMLRGEHGYQRKEVRRLGRFLASELKPNLVVLTNMLIGGCIPELKRTLGVPVLVTLQGDDAFLEYLPEPHKTRCFEQIRRLVRDVDGFLVHSRYYAEFMTGYFGISPDKLHVVPLGIDTRDDAEREFAAGSDPADRSSPDGPEQGAARSRPPTIGYLARLAPEKGLHVLCDAFIELRRRGGLDNVQLRIAGWLGEQNRAYAESLFERLRAAGLGGAFQYVGEVDRPGKREFLRSLDVLSVPTTQREPKGLFVLESLAAGVPVVLPDHGAFPELIASTGGGCLTPPNDPGALAAALAELLQDPRRLRRYADAGRRAVHQQRNAEVMARATLQVFLQYSGRPT
jgi:glycosyltransferase involved in cell wall biosynthesis